MEISHIIPHIEALIFASDKPLNPAEITEMINNTFGFMEEKLTLEQVQAALEGIIEKYGSEFYPFEVRESGGGWQFLTKKDYHKTVAQLNGEKFLKRLSSASMETLAIIAYKQPITKGEIEAIRGVSSDYSIQKLLEKELILISGRNENMPGKPLVYCTSRSFMDYFGLNTADDLPKLKEVFAETMLEPTVIIHKPGEIIQGAPAEEEEQDSPEGSQESVQIDPLWHNN
jgi:segregation and condensation protein B